MASISASIVHGLTITTAKKNSSPSLPSIFLSAQTALALLEYLYILCSRTQPNFVVIASRPHAESHDALEIELSPSWDEQGLTGFQLLATGEASFSIDLPSELSRADLGAKLAVKIIGRDFLFAMHQPYTKWKDARKLATQDRQEIFQVHSCRRQIISAQPSDPEGRHSRHPPEESVSTPAGTGPPR